MKLSFYGIIAFLLCGCHGENTLSELDLAQGWRLAEITDVQTQTPEIKGMTADFFEDNLTAEGYVLHFFPDETYTELTGYQVKTGTYTTAEGGGIRFGDKVFRGLNFEETGRARLLNGKLSMDDGNLVLSGKWVKDGARLEDFKTDPFYPEHNKWRIKPKRKESPEEIKARLINYLRHYSYILKAASEREGNVVSFTHSMGIVRVYRGGIGRVKKGNIPEEWKQRFFDEEDALAAYALFSENLNRGVYKGATTGDWVKDDYKILRTVIRKIEGE